MPLARFYSSTRVLAPQPRRLQGYSSVGRRVKAERLSHFMAPIHDAAIKGDLDALTREIGNGVSPDLSYGQGGLLPIHLVITNNFITNNNGVVDYGDLDNRLACIRLLIDAGANISAGSGAGVTALMYAAVSDHPRLVATLLNAGADANQRDDENWAPLHYAVYSDRGADSIRLLINAGAAVDARCSVGLTPLDHCIMACQKELQRGDAAGSERRRRLYPVLLRAGAPLPAEIDDADSESLDRHAESDAYIQKLRAAGSFQNYARAHLNAIAATFAPKFSHLLPPELVRRVVEYAFHVGDY